MILVTGGTGFVGQEVVRELLALGHDLRLLVRNPQRARGFLIHPRIEIVRGDALKPETLPAAMAGVQAVIHLIGIIAETSRVTFEQAHVEATRNLLAAAKQAGVTRWVQMSAAGTRPKARSRYHLTKWAAEELVRQSGLDWTIFRPSLIYGHDERDRFLNALRLALSWPVDVVLFHSLPLLNGGRAMIQPVSVREVAHCFARAVSKEAAVGQTYDLVGPVAFSWRDLVFKLVTALGKKALYEEIPLLVILRKLLWLVTLLVPILVVVGWVNERVSTAEAEIAAGLWVALVLMVSRWKRIIVFSLPSAPLLLLSAGVKAVAPRALHFGEQLKMAEEDNVGDPRPAAATFGYEPESFAHGVVRCYGLRGEVRS